MSGSAVTLVDEVVDSVRPLKSPILAFFSPRMGCCPALTACRAEPVCQKITQFRRTWLS